MERSNGNSTSQLTRARVADECPAGQHSPSSHIDDPSSLAASQKSVPNGSILGADYISGNGNPAQSEPQRQSRQHLLSSAASIQPTASTSSDLLGNTQLVTKARESIDNNLYYYHPQFAPYTSVTQRHSWPVIASTQGFLQRYPDRIEILDTPSGVSGVDSDIDLEYSSWDTLDFAYIGAWSQSRNQRWSN